MGGVRLRACVCVRQPWPRRRGGVLRQQQELRRNWLGVWIILQIPSGKKNLAVLFFSGAIGTTVFQVQDSTGTLGGTYTVSVIAQ